MASDGLHALREIERTIAEYGGPAGRRKRELLARLDQSRLPTATAVTRLHEALCFLRAYPDDAPLLRQVESMLKTFDRRSDLRRFSTELADTGIAGTDIHYEFFARMAVWLARNWPDRLFVDWSEFEHQDKLDKILHLLALYCESPAMDEYAFEVQEWIDTLKAPAETDATFLVRRLASLRMGSLLHEYFYEHLGLPLRIAAGPDTPSRTRAKVPRAKVVYQTGPLRRQRPDIRAEVRKPPLAVRPVSARQGQRYIDMACESMVTRSRDLDVFSHGDRRDVFVVDCGRGLQFVAIGAEPERRLMFEAVYGFITLMNGVPVGYVLNSALYRSVEVAYNVFETFRGGEAAYIYGRLLAVLKHLFGADTFTIYPYQLGGEGNEEGLRSGAWWFYQKLGFRARDPGVLKLMRRELARMKRDRRHRSSIATLKQLAAENVYFDLGQKRDDVIGVLPLAEVGLRITEYLSARFGSERDRAPAICGREAALRLGVRSHSSWTAGERLAWRRWSPLLLLLPGLERWRPEQKRALVEVVRAKGGRRELEFVKLFDRHARLKRVLLALA